MKVDPDDREKTAVYTSFASRPLGYVMHRPLFND